MLKTSLFSICALLCFISQSLTVEAKTYNSLNAFVLDSIGEKYDDLTKDKSDYIKVSIDLDKKTKENKLYSASRSLKNVYSKKSRTKEIIEKDIEEVNSHLIEVKAKLTESILNSTKEELNSVYREYTELDSKYYSLLDELDSTEFDILYSYSDVEGLKNTQGKLRERIYDKDSTDYIQMGVYSSLRRPFKSSFKLVGDYTYSLPYGAEVTTLFNGIVADVKGDKVTIASLKGLYVYYSGVNLKVKPGDILKQNQSIGEAGSHDVEVKLNYNGKFHSIERLFNDK